MDLFTKVKDTIKKDRRVSVPLVIAACVGGLSLGNYIYDKIDRKVHKLPPGPVGLPLFGSFFQFVLNERSFITSLRKYGPITQFNLLTIPFY